LHKIEPPKISQKEGFFYYKVLGVVQRDGGSSFILQSNVFWGARLVVGAHGFSANKTRWYIRTRNLISSTIQWLNSALHSTYLVKKYIYIGVKGTGCEKQPHKLQQKASERKGVHHHGHVHGPRKKKYSTITNPPSVHLPSAEGGRGEGGTKGVGAEHRKFNRFEFQQHKVVCVGPD